jgi:hypothetical protein
VVKAMGNLMLSPKAALGKKSKAFDDVRKLTTTALTGIRTPHFTLRIRPAGVAAFSQAQFVYVIVAERCAYLRKAGLGKISKAFDDIRESTPTA